MRLGDERLVLTNADKGFNFIYVTPMAHLVYDAWH